MAEEDLSPHQEIARTETRDNQGHFVKAGQPQTSQESPTNAPTGSPETQAKPAGNAIWRFFAKYANSSKSQDDLIDAHIGNPFVKIMTLLEEIKRQKAFNFTLKGSLGIMGVVLTLSVFGIFGGGQILCDRGTQVEIGTVRQLQVSQEDPPLRFLSSLRS